MNELSATTGTFVLDPVTMTKALTRLSYEIGVNHWTPLGASVEGNLQRRFLRWYSSNKDAVENLSNLKTEASASAAVLNHFLVDNGFTPMFDDIREGGIGVAAVLDMLVRWSVEAEITTIMRVEFSKDYSNGYKAFSHRAFEIPKWGATFYSVEGQESPLVALATKDGGAVWLMMASRPADGLALAETAIRAMAEKKPADATWWSSVQIPTLEINSQIQLDWLYGLSAGDHFINQAFQLFKLRMNEDGARVMAATGFGTLRGARQPEPLIYDQPFIGWFTQPGNSVPIAAFYADYDSWQEPAGELEDL